MLMIRSIQEQYSKYLATSLTWTQITQSKTHPIRKEAISVTTWAFPDEPA